MRVAIVGAAGQARDAAWVIRALNAQSARGGSGTSGGSLEFGGFVVSDLSSLSDRDSKDAVIGDLSALNDPKIDGVVLGIGTPAARLRVATTISRDFPRLEWPSIVHPSAVLDRESLKLGRGVMVSAQVAGSVNIVVEDFALVNIGVTLGHEAHVGRGCVINHGASISGGVTLHESVLVGTGARILQYLSVGEGSIVGAGAVVTKSVPSGVVMVGVPARARAQEAVR